MDYTNANNAGKVITEHRHILCWRSAFAGLAIALLTMVGVIALSIAFGGMGLQDGTTAKNAGIFAVVSVIVAMVLGNFVGSYFSVRIARFNLDVVGVMQGLLVGALCTLVVMCHLMGSVVALGKVTGAALGAGVTAAAAAAPGQAPMIEDILEDSLGNKKLGSDPELVLRNVAARMLRGDQESAKNYLALQAGMSAEEANKTISEAKAKVDAGLEEARKVAAASLKALGWSLFVALVLATIGSVLGGMVAALCNARRPIDVVVVKK